VVGFGIQRFSSFDPDEPANAVLSRPPLFDAPQLGLMGASAMEIAIATRALYGEAPSLNRIYFSAAAEASGEQALELWLRCLQTGDQMAHFALGYTLFDLERFQEAYRHLRYYCEVAPAGSWNWCWFGRAAAAIGETGEARAAFERAIELERNGDAETDALEQLQLLR
jgi:tetratricopeptide (TPR) repeat protein